VQQATQAVEGGAEAEEVAAVVDTMDTTATTVLMAPTVLPAATLLIWAIPETREALVEVVVAEEEEVAAATSPTKTTTV